MNFIEAYEKLRREGQDFPGGSCDFTDSDYDYGGEDWLEWCPEAQNGLERDIIGDVFAWESVMRRPYYRMRGRAVTTEQARDILLRTDIENEDVPGHVHSMNFDNWWRVRGHDPFGWCHPDGTIGINGITQRYPNAAELLLEFYELACAFPFLELCAVITQIEEFQWENRNDPVLREYYADAYSDDWTEYADIGIVLHEGTLTMLHREEALAAYRRYSAAYGIPGADDAPPERNPYDTGYYCHPQNAGKLRWEEAPCGGS